MYSETMTLGDVIGRLSGAQLHGREIREGGVEMMRENLHFFPAGGVSGAMCSSRTCKRPLLPFYLGLLDSIGSIHQYKVTITAYAEP